jgi:hypothetical protein
MFSQAFFHPLSLFLIFASGPDLLDELCHRVMHKLGTQGILPNAASAMASKLRCRREGLESSISALIDSTT